MWTALRPGKPPIQLTCRFSWPAVLHGLSAVVSKAAAVHAPSISFGIMFAPPADGARCASKQSLKEAGMLHRCLIALTIIGPTGNRLSASLSLAYTQCWHTLAFDDALIRRPVRSLWLCKDDPNKTSPFNEVYHLAIMRTCRLSHSTMLHRFIKWLVLIK